MVNGLIGQSGLTAQLFVVEERNTETDCVTALHLNMAVNHAVETIQKLLNVE